MKISGKCQVSGLEPAQTQNPPRLRVGFWATVRKVVMVALVILATSPIPTLAQAPSLSLPSNQISGVDVALVERSRLVSQEVLEVSKKMQERAVTLLSQHDTMADVMKDAILDPSMRKQTDDLFTTYRFLGLDDPD